MEFSYLNRAKDGNYFFLANMLGLSRLTGFLLPRALLSCLALIITFSISSSLPLAYSDENVNYPVNIVFKAYSSSDGGFDPDPLHIKVGDTVTWTNHDLVAHALVHGTPTFGPETEFESPLLTYNQSFSHTFSQAGTYPYFDHLHPTLTGTIIVGDERTPLPAITLDTDKIYYQKGETVHISGMVANVTEGQSILLQVFNPEGLPYRFDQVAPSPTDGSFSYDVQISGPIGVHGDYSIRATYGPNTTVTGFRLLAQLSTLTINSVLPDGAALNMWTIVEFPTFEGNQQVLVGFTPSTFEVPQETSYKVTVQDYLDSKFDHWENGSTNRTRTVDLSANTTITAYYKSGSSIRGFTSLMYDSSGQDASPVASNLTIQAISINGGQDLHMWTRIENLGHSADGDTYKVTVHDYFGMRFDHWQDGGKERTRTFTIANDTTMTAYYSTS